MKTSEVQIIKGSEIGSANTQEMVQQAQYLVMQGEMDAQQAEADESEMRDKLEQALAAKARSESAKENAALSAREIQGTVA